MKMRIWLTESDEFEANFSALLDCLSIGSGIVAAEDAGGESPQETVKRIVRDVRARGDEALLQYTESLDRCSIRPEQVRVSDADIQAAVDRCSKDYLASLHRATERIRLFQESILLRDPEPLVGAGRSLGIRYTPVESVGVYVPGGSAPLASSLLMAAVPARVAGVDRVVVATPPGPDGSISGDRLAAANVAGVDEVYRMGGAQAIAALAFGTESVPRVDFIAGPGNIYVLLAKKEVFGHVGIEMLPGPSEVVIIADATARPDYVAADLISQSEHNPGSSVLLTDAPPLAGAVSACIEEQLADLPRAAEARSCLEKYGAVIVCQAMSECVELANRLAPEHLSIIANDPAGIAEGVRHAGAVFLGPWTPVAVGDYIAGPSHVLPTSATARFSSGLSANDFLKRSSVMRYDRPALREDADDVIRLASAEGLEGHARSVSIRREGEERP